MATTSAGERSTNRSEHSVSKTSPRSVSLNARAGVGRGCWLPGWASTTVQRRSGDLEGRARRFYTDVLSQLIGRLQEFVPSSRLIPSSPATFPCTSMIRCAFLSSFSSRAFRRSSLRTFSSSGFRSGLRPRFFDRAFSDPLCAALRHVVRCDEYRPSRRRTLPWAFFVGAVGSANMSLMRGSPPYDLEIDVRFPSRLIRIADGTPRDYCVGIGVKSITTGKLLYNISTDRLGVPTPPFSGPYEIKISIQLNLAPGAYNIRSWIRDVDLKRLAVNGPNCAIEVRPSHPFGGEVQLNATMVPSPLRGRM